MYSVQEYINTVANEVETHLFNDNVFAKSDMIF